MEILYRCDFEVVRHSQISMRESIVDLGRQFFGNDTLKIMKVIIIVVLLIVEALGIRSERRATRIVHGHEASRDEHPYVVSIQQEHGNGHYYHFCGGSLIEPNYVLSAAHCLQNKEASSLQVVLGAHDLTSPLNLRVGVAEVIVHPYDDKIKVNDVALLRLKAYDSQAALARPIELSDCSDVVGETCLVSGWGRESFSGPAHSQLMEAEVRVVSEAGCVEMLDSELWDASSMMCAGGRDRDACQGDSGGPLVCPRPKGALALHGIVSWGFGCATPGVPGVYTDVCKMKEWIKANTQSSLNPSSN